jgi:hypothetical protein
MRLFFLPANCGGAHGGETMTEQMMFIEMKKIFIEKR